MLNCIESNYRPESLETVGRYLSMFAKTNYEMIVELVSLLHRNIRNRFLKYN